MLAIRALKRFAERGVRVPEDMSVVGCDDIFGADFCNPPLTTLTSPIDQVGRLATDMLLTRLSGLPLARGRQKVPARLTIRQSTGPVRKRSERVHLGPLVAAAPAMPWLSAGLSRLGAPLTTDRRARQPARGRRRRSVRRPEGARSPSVDLSKPYSATSPTISPSWIPNAHAIDGLDRRRRERGSASRIQHGDAAAACGRHGPDRSLMP